MERAPPALVPEERWWANPWPALLVGIVGLIVGGLVGYAAGHNSETVTVAQGAAAPITRTVTQANTVVQPKVIEHVHTATVTTQTPAPANPAVEERRNEAETRLRKAERENEELKRQLESNAAG